MNLRPRIVGEINTGHFGDMSLAREAILAAKSAGLDVIKFQSWKPESLYTSRYLEENRLEAGLYKRFSLGRDELHELANFSHEAGIAFSSTPYSEEEVEELAAMPNLAFIKVASMEVNNHQFLKHVARMSKPIVLSTGMSTFDEVENAVRTILDSAECDLTLLHCTSVYPTPDEELNLANITTLKSMFPDLNVGYSDHSEGVEAGVAAIALGAVLLEKHFTTSKTKIGFDNAMAMSVEEIRAYVSSARKTAAMIGSMNRSISNEESIQKSKMRRSLFLARAVVKGEIIDSSCLVAKRPGEGIAPSELHRIVGREFTQDLAKDDKLVEGHFK